MNNVYEVLEKCLLEIDRGADVDTILFQHPEFADELRPILEASVKAKSMAVPAPSADVVRRNRARVLQRAAEMREAKSASQSRRIWSVPLRRALVSLMMVATLLVSGTGLVHAASTTIPGDNLYPVKRTWEDVLVLFTFNVQARTQLEFEHDNERLDELNELFTEGRSANVDFSGYVSRQTGNEWRVSGITVVISDQTALPDQSVPVGAAVRVVGVTQSDKTVLAQQIELLPADAKLPEVQDDEQEIEHESTDEQNQQIEENSNSGSESENEAPEIESTKSPESESDSDLKKDSFGGVLESIDEKNQIWTVNGRLLNVSGAEINGTPVVGAGVKVEGYYNANGVFIVTKVEIVSGSNYTGNSDSTSDDNSNDSGTSNSNSNHDDDDENNTNTNTNEESH